ncbi:30S ribosomal protein S3 [bacterium]|nr:30S ribosomal protein S3 [bacterium]
MGQKISPIGYRVGIFEGWQSRWYASKQEYSDLLIEDFKVREFVRKAYAKAGIPRVEIERTRDEVKVMLMTARPGVIIGRKGTEVDKLQEDLQKLTGRRINIKIVELQRPEIDAQLISEDLAQQIERRASFRRAMKRTAEQVIEAGAKGVKIHMAGRLAGSEMARQEKVLIGSVPLSTLRAKISYGFTEAMTAQGHIGIKVWVNQGFYDMETTDGANAEAGQVPQKSKRKSKR